MADHRQNYGATAAPLVVGDLVISGVSGGDEGIRGFVAAYDAATGKEAWRFWTVPARGEPGSETWKGKDIEHGCAATWLTGTFDAVARHGLLAHRQSLPRLRRRRARRRQPLFGFDRRARAEDRQAEMALPVHAARPVGLGRAAAAGAGRRRLERHAAQAPAPRQPQRLLLRARSHERRVPAREAVRQEADVGQRHRREGPPHRQSTTRSRRPTA